MRSSVADVLPLFLEMFEGRVEWMYQDKDGHVTIGFGTLIDSEQAAAALPARGALLRKKDPPQDVATDGEIRAEWHRVKDDRAHTGHADQYGPFTNLRLEPTGADVLREGKLAEIMPDLLLQFPEFANWPADAQLGLINLAWWQGASLAVWTGFSDACNGTATNGVPNWIAAAREVNVLNGAQRRNAVNRGVFRSAAWAVANGRPPEELRLAVPGGRRTLKLLPPPAGPLTGPDVAELQGSLAFMGQASLGAPGVYDAPTAAAVRLFQQDEGRLRNGAGFLADGEVGPHTWAALGYLVPRA